MKLFSKLLYFLNIVFLFGSALSCTPRLESHFLRTEDITFKEANPRKEEAKVLNGQEIRIRLGNNNTYNKLEDYIPDPAHLNHHPGYTLRVNFHFVDAGPTGTYNYDREAGEKMIQQLLHSANKDLLQNNPSFLPYGNQMPVLPIGYTMKLMEDASQANGKAIYFHENEPLAFYVHKGRHRNLHKREVINKYQIAADSVMNIFFMPHHLDSVASPTYHAGAVGIYLGKSIKMAGMFELGKPGWNYRGVLNHEMGHGLGINHAWLRDGCDDTPQHNNECWNRSKKPPCDTAASNNIMDYNAYQNAWTPCQVGRIRRVLANEAHPKRACLIPHWNQLDTSRNIVIQDSVFWGGAKDLKGNLIIKEGAHLSLSCRLGMPVNSQIIVEPNATLTLEKTKIHHPAQLKWQGIKIQQLGKRKGKVIFIGDNKVENVENELILK